MSLEDLIEIAKTSEYGQYREFAMGAIDRWRREGKITDKKKLEEIMQIEEFRIKYVDYEKGGDPVFTRNHLNISTPFTLPVTHCSGWGTRT
jgi:hypothetical protein